ncbi:helix-turn-helix transcriptional regulator [Thalassolituus pacificus]|uniref:helix-turn-helix transcriptional regulator n=1 Tax=Thalassolituus pacificus TaxID=2975440 RepID=UPI003B846639
MDFLSKPRVSLADLSRKLNISQKTLRLWEQNGTLPRMNRIGSVKFWTEDQIADWEARNVVPADVTTAQSGA